MPLPQAPRVSELSYTNDAIIPYNIPITWICLRGPQKIKNIHYRFPQMVDFLLGK